MDFVQRNDYISFWIFFFFGKVTKITRAIIRNLKHAHTHLKKMKSIPGNCGWFQTVGLYNTGIPWCSHSGWKCGGGQRSTDTKISTGSGSLGDLGQESDRNSKLSGTCSLVQAGETISSPCTTRTILMIARVWTNGDFTQ